MSELVWNPELPEGATTEVDTQISRPLGQTDDAQPLTRRELRERREREEAAATSALVELGFVAAEPVAVDSVLPAAGAPVTTVTPAAAALPLRPRSSGKAPRSPKARRPPKAQRSSAQKKRSKPARAKASTRPATRAAASVLPSLARRPRFGGRAMLAKLMSFGAMVGVAGMLVATSVPANAFHPETAQVAQAAERQLDAKVEVQSLSVQEAEALTAKAAVKDEYTILSLSEQLHNRYGNQVFTFTNNPNGTIQWPFATSVPIASGFGARMACSYCSSQHMGVDFTPGAGAPIQAIADGVVNDVIVSNGGLGVHVVIDHVINGQNIQSVYAHMRWGSPAVAQGQTVKVGQYLGDVGSTGASTGAHLHLEIHVEGTPVDPFVWLKANAN